MKLFAVISIFFFSTLFSYSQTGHWEELFPSINPGARAQHDMAPIGKNKVLLFGGDGTEIYNDTWIFDLQTGQWTRIECESKPLKRKDHRMVQISEKRILLFGGESIDSVFKDLWMFDLDSLNWQKIIPNNETTPTFKHGMAKLNDNEVVVFGGNRYGIVFPKFPTNETWVYKIIENEWERLQYFPLNLKSRSSLMMTNIDTNSVFMTGGHGLGLLNDNWLFRKNKNGDYSWREIDNIQKNIIPISSSDIEHIGGGTVLLFGGDADGDPTPDSWYDGTWIFDYVNQAWIELNLEVKPSSRFFNRMAKIDWNKVLLFGGRSMNTPQPVDTWLFVLDSGLTSVIEENKIDSITITISNSNELRIQYYLTKPSFVHIEIININGRIIHTEEETYEQVGISNKYMQLTNLAPGVYLIIIKIGIKIIVDKFIIL